MAFYNSPRINKAVYSLWSKPSGGDILRRARHWYSAEAQLMCLALSVKKSAQWFEEVELITDSFGWRVIKKLNLPFTNVKLSLDNIPDKLYPFWALGKIYAYKEQDKPFVHIDNDAIFFRKPPEWALSAQLFVQNIEDGQWFNHCYKREVDHATSILPYLPPGWGKIKEAYCTAVLGSVNIDFIQKYCEEALKFVWQKENQRAWQAVTNKGSYCIIFEQYILACLCKEYKIPVTFFDRHANNQKLTSYGFTHLWDAKKKKETEEILFNYIRNSENEIYNKVLSIQ